MLDESRDGGVEKCVLRRMLRNMKICIENGILPPSYTQFPFLYKFLPSTKSISAIPHYLNPSP